MTFSNPFPVKADDTSTLNASEINTAGVYISRAVDGVGGGTYTPSTPIEIGGEGLIVGGLNGLTVDGPVTITGPVQLDDTTPIALGSRSRTRTAGPLYYLGATVSATSTGVVSTGATTVESASWFLLVPHNAELTSVSVTISPAGGHGALPTAMPIISVVYLPANSITGVTVASATDTSASVAAYETVHQITLNTSHVVNRTDRMYSVTLSFEGDPNAVAGAFASVPQWTAMVTELDDA